MQRVDKWASSRDQKRPRRSGASIGLHYFLCPWWVWYLSGACLLVAGGVGLLSSGLPAFMMGFSVAVSAAWVIGFVFLAGVAFSASDLASFSAAFFGTGLTAGSAAFTSGFAAVIAGLDSGGSSAHFFSASLCDLNVMRETIML